MLIQPDSSKLGTKTPVDAEAMAQLKEINLRKAEEFKVPDQEILEDKVAALGHPMQPSDFILRLQKLNPKILIEKGGVRNSVAVRYVPRGQADKVYVTGFPIDIPLPEFSAIVVDDEGRPFRELRGWRSVLLALVKKDLITMHQVKLTFGYPTGRRAILWEKNTSERTNS